MSKNRGLKMLLWIGLSILIVGIVVTTALLAYQIKLRKTELAQSIMNNPDTSAVVVFTVDAEGNPVEDGKDIFLNADTPLVTASMMKLVVLVAYESAVTQGELDPKEQIKVADLERYYLPKTDGGAHINGLSTLGIKTDDLGFALDQALVIPLDEIARIMVHYSGNAETDYLISRLGVEKVNSIPGMEKHTSIRSILGISLAMMNHENSLADVDLRQNLIRDVALNNNSYCDHLVDLYLNDSGWRAKQIEFMRSDQYLVAATNMGWQGQVEAAELFPRGTAREYALLMAKIASGQLISAQVSGLIQEKIENIPADWPLRAFFFSRYGSKDGLTAGLINLASYGVPKNGPLNGDMRVVVVMTNDLPVETWSSQVTYQGVYLLQTDLARAQGVFGRLTN